MLFRLTAPSSALVTRLGVRTECTAHSKTLRAAMRQAELSLHEQRTFDDAGTIKFGHGNSVRFHSLGLGRLVELVATSGRGGKT